MKPKVINVPAAEADRTVAVCQGLYAQGFLDAQMEFQRIMFVSTLDMPLLTKVVQKEIPTFVDTMEAATKLQHLTQKSNGNGQIHCIQEQNLDTSDAKFVNQIQQGYHSNRGNNCGNSRGCGNQGQSCGNGNRGNRGHSPEGYYSNKPANNGNSNNSGNNQNKEAP